MVETLREESRQAAYRNLRMAGELIELVDLFVRHGIAVLTYKGPTLAVAAYGSLVRRRFLDLDLLIRPADFAQAERLLVERGYRLFEDEWLRVRHLGHEVPFHDPKRGVHVDLHRRLLSRELFPADMEAIWKRRRPVVIADREIETLAPEDHLLLLCEHAHKHLWRRFAWIADQAHLVARQRDLDWAALAAHARAAGSRRVLHVGLLLTGGLLAAPIPESVLDEARGDRMARALAENLQERLFSRSPEADKGGEDAELGSLQWRSRERWRDRLRILLTPNESDWIVWPLPAGLRFAYYVMRPLRLMSQYARRALRTRG